MSKTAILVDGGFYRKRAKYLWGEKTAEERAKELAAALVFYIAVDWHIKDAGLIRGGEIGAAAWVIIALVAISFSVMTSVLLSALRYGKRFGQPGEERGEV